MINVIQATEIMRKYCPETKLKLTNGCDGLYLQESDTILVGRYWHLGGLLHEITHALLYKEDGRTGHDGVFADKLTQLVGEVFCEVPSYEEWQASYNCMLENEVLRLKNAQLKELLKECKDLIELMQAISGIKQIKFTVIDDFVKKINEVLDV